MPGPVADCPRSPWPSHCWKGGTLRPRQKSLPPKQQLVGSFKPVEKYYNIYLSCIIDYYIFKCHQVSISSSKKDGKNAYIKHRKDPKDSKSCSKIAQGLIEIKDRANLNFPLAEK